MQSFERESTRQDQSQESAQLVMETIMLGLRAIYRRMGSGRPAGFSVPMFRALSYLNCHGGASLSDVAEHIGLALPSMSKAVDTLVRRGLVTREHSCEDRRRVTLALTPTGREMFNAALGAIQSQVADMLKVLSSDERSVVVQAMHILRPVFEPTRSNERANDDRNQ